MEILFIIILLITLFLTIVAIPGYRKGDALQLIMGCVEMVGAIFLGISLMMILVVLFPPLDSAMPLWSAIAFSLLYIVPRSLVLSRQMRWARLKGLIAAFVIVALLSGGCWILLTQSGA
jgi:hypothetical protein